MLFPMYLLDSDILVFLKRGRFHIQERVNQVGLSNCALSEISLAELYVGVYKNNEAGQLHLMELLEDLFEIVPITSALKTYAQIRVQLEAQGNRLEDMNLFIAATALANDYTLVTHNTRHFSRIPGLKLEDWIE